MCGKKKMTESLIIFDVDNTLIKYKEGLDFFDNILIEALKEHNIAIPSDKERLTIWQSGKDYPLIFERWGIEGEKILEFWKTFDKLDTEIRKEMTLTKQIVPNDHVYEVLEQLSDGGFQLAALSNSNQPITEFFLKYFKLKKFFVAVRGLSPEKHPLDCKPEINNYIKLINSMGFDDSSNDVYIVGDSYTDILLAKRVNARAFLLNPNYEILTRIKQALSGFDYKVIDSLRALLQILMPSN
ncbi:MAG: HAD hydrolase-like protein [Candidatus Lokiarchaeota archaeon]|nr:HAD hydrolase-like protein [Candidatus Lokiarchaeota archaeon]